MDNFEYIQGGSELLDLIHPLWKKLNKHHENKSIYFKYKFKNFTFKTRKNKFISSDNIKIKVDLVKYKNSYIAYCISTINKELTGEIDSLYVDETYRNLEIGDKLMTRSLSWLNNNKVKRKIIGISAGNESVFKFYKKYGFFKRTITLEQIS
ncbi:GNAT family N-acetyltransferase [Clostridium sp. JS66]|uniref:GNAT family N-acetyltransferase n=1 Tax=Clostridium sp. JS66 TaxID=3064705 RepID=UPI00298DA2C7|nr:GNAT family N-acetyltransferase [Clostridium sp. JS66]WPC44418.1 GNAT family N-acetyltransferase [Clostridium sp. JS66]